MPIRPKTETPEQREKRLIRQRAYEARRRAKDPEKWAAVQAKAQKRYRERHPEKSKASVKKWRDANRPAHNEMRRRHRANNLVATLVREARARARKQGIKFTITLHDIPPMGEQCPLLGHPFPPSDVRKTPFSPSLDRIDPRKGYVPGNVWIVGYRANRIKNDATADELQQIAHAIRMASAT
jgi:hypothetical protein